MIGRLLISLLKAIDRGLNRCVRGGFGLKDVFTVWNLLGGVASICFAIHGDVGWAAGAVMLGYLGDVLDGPMARLTGRTNRFGSELDSIADHLSQCVAPAFVVYLVYRPESIVLGFALAALMVVTGSIRHARGAAAPFEFDLCWNGMPRPVGAFIVLSFLNSSLFEWLPAGSWIGVALVGAVAVLNLVSLPFMNHHGRKLQLYVKVAVVGSFAVAIGLALLAPRYFWDAVFVIVFGYSLFSWVPMSKQEREAYFAEARRWHRRLEGEMFEEKAAERASTAAAARSGDSIEDDESSENSDSSGGDVKLAGKSGA
jgi:CDP-diacylglycerol--serine O-phosphatidyltransferase